MRHPFDGLTAADAVSLPRTPAAAPASPARRTVLGRLAIAVGGLLGLNARARAQQVSTRAIGEEGGGQMTTMAVGEEGGLQLLTEAKGEQGMPMTRALNEVGYRQAFVPPVWNAAWNYLAAIDPAHATQPNDPEPSRRVVQLLADQLPRDVVPADDKRVNRLIRDLDSMAFATRENASAELLKIGPGAVPHLEKILASNPSLELVRRVEGLLVKLRTLPTLCRAQRGIDLLLMLGIPESRELLEKLAKAKPESWLNPLAQAALERGTPQPVAQPLLPQKR